MCVTCVTLVFTIEWFVHINIFYVMLNVFSWWLFLGLFDWHFSWETTRFELNWCTLPLKYYSIWIRLTNEWVSEWMGVCVVCWRRCELYEWPLCSSEKQKQLQRFSPPDGFYTLFVTPDQRWPTCFAWFSRFFEFIRLWWLFVNCSLFLFNRLTNNKNDTSWS